MGSFTGPTWSEEPTARLRLYAVTGGRTEPSHRMRLATLVKATPSTVVVAEVLSQEAEQALALCRQRPCSVAEVAGTLGLSAHVTKIILSELIESGALTLALPPTEASAIEMTEVLLARLKKKFAM
ncbi:DUF742 domain-containing protein [Streptomyces sp. NPDC006923]|uniref:DUF742 domain-containing protein n=1 Tax=Streptomyces sp. NPDC006923 TaxID=3155355 RepID=UPI003401AE94